ncbi:Hydroquinone glucosyltransferase [Triticum urartu]|uniref:Hydroquinone glucosyltransferase n=1 Tax=Triticum urartu TaxID=4572 RepID=M7ZIV3_TRIUA|nr:Hydroquinone glucosyltransferase [Triticum urartu]
MDDLPANVHEGRVLAELARRSLPNIRALLRSVYSTTLLAAVVPDFLCPMALPIAAELGVPGYLFFPSNLAMVALTRHIVELHDGAAPGEYRDVAVPLELPGGVSLCGADMPDAFRASFTNPRYAKLVELVRSYRLADGILVNTFYEMELGTAEAFKRLAAPEQAAGEGFFPHAGMNAVILEEKLGVALRVPAAREDDRCLVTRHEIATAVKELVEEGQKLRRRAESLQKAAAGAWSPEGPSRRALEEVAVKLKVALGIESGSSDMKKESHLNYSVN